MQLTALRTLCIILLMHYICRPVMVQFLSRIKMKCCQDCKPALTSLTQSAAFTGCEYESDLMLSLSLSLPRPLTPPLPCVVVYVFVGERGPHWERVHRVTAVLIGTQVSFGALGRLDNTYGPHSPVWKPQNTHERTPTHVHILQHAAGSKVI